MLTRRFTSHETTPNNLNHPLLLFGRHFVVAREAQPSGEDVGADVDAGAGDVSVRLGAAAAGARDERVVAV